MYDVIDALLPDLYGCLQGIPKSGELRIVQVGAVRYVASQPWPFPSSLMIACIGEAESEAITIDVNELEDARWFSRDDVLRALARDPAAPFVAPPAYAIAHTLLTAWAEG